MKIYDLIIIGAGVSGITVGRLIDPDSKVLIIEKGKNINTRRHLVYGWFGSSLHTMNNLKTRTQEDHSEITDRLNIPYNLTESKRREIALESYSHLVDKTDVLLNTEVISITKKDNFFNVCIPGGFFRAKTCVIATGQDTLLVRDLESKDAKISVGMRVEIPTRIIKNRLEVQDFKYNGLVGERERYGINSAFGYLSKDKQSSKSNFFVGVEISFSEAKRYMKIINVLNGDRIKKERLEHILSGKSYLKGLPIFKSLQDKLSEICVDNYSFISCGICYSPEIYGRGVMKNIPKEKLFCVGRCTDQAITSADSIITGIKTTKKIEEVL